MIRIATAEDVPQILAVYAPYIMTSTATFEYDVPCKKDFLQRFLKITAQFPWLVWEEDGQILGYAYASAPFERPAYSWCAEPSIYLCPEAKGKGIAQKLYDALEKILLRQGYQVLYALITSENLVSRRFHEKCGYTQTAEFSNCGYKFQRWLGLIWMEKRLKPVELPNAMPKRFGDIQQDVQRKSDILDNLSLS